MLKSVLLQRRSGPVLTRALSSPSGVTLAPKIDAANLVVEKSKNPKQKTPLGELVFGRTFSDHMVQVYSNVLRYFFDVTSVSIFFLIVIFC
jgi:hypothetical protein